MLVAFLRLSWVYIPTRGAGRTPTSRAQFRRLVRAVHGSPLVAGILLFVLPPKAVAVKAPADPRWENLHSTPLPDKQGAIAARGRKQDRQAIIGSIIAVGLILGLFLFFWVSA